MARSLREKVAVHLRLSGCIWTLRVAANRHARQFINRLSEMQALQVRDQASRIGDLLDRGQYAPATATATAATENHRIRLIVLLGKFGSSAVDGGLNIRVVGVHHQSRLRRSRKATKRVSTALKSRHQRLSFSLRIEMVHFAVSTCKLSRGIEFNHAK